MESPSKLLWRNFALVRNLVDLYLPCSPRSRPRGARQSTLLIRSRSSIPHLYLTQATPFLFASSCSHSLFFLSRLCVSLIEMANVMAVLLMFVSGLTLQEVPSAQKRYQKSLNWEAYQEYLRRTSILFPLPPAMYAPMPVWLKRTLLLEFPMYVFHPTKDDEEQRRRNQDSQGGTPRGSNVGLTTGQEDSTRT